MIKKYVFNSKLRLEDNVSCIGYFDGVHRGHQQILNKTIELARLNNVKAYVITFNPDPYEIINKKKTHQITTFKKRIELFERFGMDGVIVVPFDEKMMQLNEKDFKKQVLDKLNIKTLVCGFDFTYGYMGKGNINTLKKQKINLVVVDEFKYYGKKISSTRIRNEIYKKNYNLVNKLLGYEYK